MEQGFKEVAEVTAQDVSLEAIVEEMFGSGRTTYTTRKGQVVTFQQAKFKQIATVTRLFQNLLERIPRDQFAALLGAIVESQVDAMAQGKSQNDMVLNATQLVEKAIGEKSLILTVFANVLDILPDFVPNFCDMKADEFNDLELDEAVMVATGVVAVNYSFFTQTLPPLLKSALGGWSKKQSSTGSTKSNNLRMTDTVG